MDKKIASILVAGEQICNNNNDAYHRNEIALVLWRFKMHRSWRRQISPQENHRKRVRQFFVARHCFFSYLIAFSGFATIYLANRIAPSASRERFAIKKIYAHSQLEISRVRREIYAHHKFGAHPLMMEILGVLRERSIATADGGGGGSGGSALFFLVMNYCEASALPFITHMSYCSK